MNTTRAGSADGVVGDGVRTCLSGGAVMETATARDRRARFEDSEALRALLTRLHEAGRGAWRHDPEAAALMEHAARKYAALARKHGQDPWEAASAAFEAMRGAATRRAEDPWAVITRAVDARPSVTDVVASPDAR